MKGRKRNLKLHPNRKNLHRLVEFPIHENPMVSQSRIHCSDGLIDSTVKSIHRSGNRQALGGEPLESVRHCIKLNQMNNLTDCAIALSNLKFRGLSVFIDGSVVRSEWPSKDLFLEKVRNSKNSESKVCSQNKKRKQKQSLASNGGLKKFKFLSPAGNYVEVVTARRSRPDLRNGVASPKRTKSSDLLSSTSSDVFSTGRVVNFSIKDLPHPVAITNEKSNLKGGAEVEEEDFGVIESLVDMGNLCMENSHSEKVMNKVDSVAGDSNGCNLQPCNTRVVLGDDTHEVDDVFDDYAIAQILSERFGSEKHSSGNEDAALDISMVANFKSNEVFSEKLMAKQPVSVISNAESNLSQMTLSPSPSPSPSPSLPCTSCSTPDSISKPMGSFTKAEIENDVPLFVLSADEVVCHSVSNSPSPTAMTLTAQTSSITNVGCEEDELESKEVELKTGGVLKAQLDSKMEEEKEKDGFCSRTSFSFFRKNRSKFDPKMFQSLSTVKSMSGVFVYKRNKCNEDDAKATNATL